MHNRIKIAAVLTLSCAALSACGPGGGLSHAAPNGQSKHAVASGPPDLLSIDMAGPTTGWAVAVVGQRVEILRTESGGRFWTNVSPAGMPAPPDITTGDSFDLVSRGGTVWFAAERAAGGTAQTVVYRTSDNGKHWRAAVVHWAGGGQIVLDFASPQRGWMLLLGEAGMGQMQKALYRTTDAGASWTRLWTNTYGPVPGALPMTGYPSGMAFADGRHGWVAGYAGLVTDCSPYLYASSDAGRDWQAVPLALPPGFVARTQNAPNGYCASGWAPTFSSFAGVQGTLVLDLWRLQNNQVGSPTQALAYRTDDGGRTWSYGGLLQFPGTVVPFFADPAHGWILGLSTAGRPATLYRTANGGRSWQSLALPPAARSFVASGAQLDFVDPLHGFLLLQAQDGISQLFRSANGGSTWLAVAAR